MPKATLKVRLTKAAKSADFPSEAESIVDGLAASPPALASVRTILQFIEENPTLDFGAPGPLVHYVETFYGAGYEAELGTSIRRRPTAHTLWMLNRIINGTTDVSTRRGLIALMEASVTHSEADAEARAEAGRFLKRLR